MVENFHGFCWSENSREDFLMQNFKFIIDARRGWKLDHEILSGKICFLAEFDKTVNIYPLKFLGYTVDSVSA